MTTTPESSIPQTAQPAYGWQPPQQGYGWQQPAGPPGYPQPMPGAPVQWAQPNGPVGRVRSTGVAMLLFVVTLGIYGLYYYFVTHEEMKKHSGEGIGGVLGLVIGLLVGFVSPFVLSHEVGELYARQGRGKPVSAVTGLWAVLGWVVLVGPIVWFVKTNGALNAYWRSVGAR
jgi:hypothetical protein